MSLASPLLAISTFVLPQYLGASSSYATMVWLQYRVRVCLHIIFVDLLLPRTRFMHRRCIRVWSDDSDILEISRHSFTFRIIYDHSQSSQTKSLLVLFHKLRHCFVILPTSPSSLIFYIGSDLTGYIRMPNLTVSWGGFLSESFSMFSMLSIISIFNRHSECHERSRLISHYSYYRPLTIKWLWCDVLQPWNPSCWMTRAGCAGW